MGSDVAKTMLPEIQSYCCPIHLGIQVRVKATHGQTIVWRRPVCGVQGGGGAGWRGTGSSVILSTIKIDEKNRATQMKGWWRTRNLAVQGSGSGWSRSQPLEPLSVEDSVGTCVCCSACGGARGGHLAVVGPLGLWLHPRGGRRGCGGSLGALPHLVRPLFPESHISSDLHREKARGSGEGPLAAENKGRRRKSLMCVLSSSCACAPAGLAVLL